jgi:PAS domain S-box-containing protein
MRILLLAPDSEMAEVARKTLADKSGSVEIVEALLNAALPIARRAETEGFDAIVTRGGTALLLKSEGVKTPIVEIPLAPEDMAKALAEASTLTGKSRPRIGVVAFPNMTLGLEALAPVLHLDLTYYPLEREEDTCQAIERAFADNVDVVLGGVVTYRQAKERNVPAALLRCGPKSFLLAFQEAQTIAYARRLEKQRAEEFKAIIDYAHEGIVAVNLEGRITVFNPVTEHLTGVQASAALGKPVRDVIPEIRLKETLSSGRRELNELVSLGRTRLLVSRVPIRVDGHVTGAVGTLQNVTNIQKVEAKIRREAHVKGHVARFRFSDLIGKSPVLLEAMKLARDFAHTESAVLIHGETGVGKELFAQSIHYASRRGHGPFVPVNCAALPENLLESELFGYTEGAFTGARRGGKAGLFELAHGGTLFLDEVSEIPLALQGRLLRVLQEREVMRLGYDRVIPVDVRVISATNRNLEQRVDQGLFRPDLFFRLNVLSLRVPPLRERPGDVTILLDHFLRRHTGKRLLLSEAALKFLSGHGWPGNVRELENWCERLVAVFPSGGEIGVHDTARLLGTGLGSKPVRAHAVREEIRWALEQAGGKQGKAAKILGVHRVTLWRRLAKAEGRE